AEQSGQMRADAAQNEIDTSSRPGCVRHPRLISRPATRRQRVMGSGVGANSGGMEALQRSSEKRQRGAKPPPSGSARKSGGMPEIASSRLPKAEPSAVEVSSAAV